MSFLTDDRYDAHTLRDTGCKIPVELHIAVSFSRAYIGNRSSGSVGRRRTVWEESGVLVMA